LPKQWQWKNAYHSFEHALVGYIVAQQLQGEPVTLYYAFPADPPTAPADPPTASDGPTPQGCRRPRRRT
jgi:hypothetical protein